MSLSHHVEVDGVVVPATVARLTEAELADILDLWKDQYVVYAGPDAARIRESVYEWDWAQVERMATGRVLGLRVAGSNDFVGLIAVTQRAKMKGGRSCVGVIFLAKMPMAFVSPRIRGVARSLLAEAVRMSLYLRKGGRVRIKQALGAESGGSGYDPARTYRGLHFKGAGPKKLT